MLEILAMKMHLNLRLKDSCCVSKSTKSTRGTRQHVAIIESYKHAPLV